MPTEANAFFVVFLCQIIIGSLFVPYWVHRRLKLIFAEHPPSDYPRFYPESLDVELGRLQMFRFSAIGIGILGLGVYTFLLFNTSTDGFHRLSLLAAVVFGLVQMIPIMQVCYWYYCRVKNMKNAQSPIRSADLRVYHVFDIVPLTHFLMALVPTVLVIGLGGYIFLNDLWPFRQAGLWVAIVAAPLIAAFYFAVCAYTIREGVETDPYVISSERVPGVEQVVKYSVLSVFDTSLLILFALFVLTFGLQSYVPAMLSLYFLMVVAQGLEYFSRFGSDFECYRDDVQTAL